MQPRLHRQPNPLHPRHPLHPRTLALLATPAVIGAMTVAVPALAGTSLFAASTAHRASSSRCLTVLSGHRRVRECLIPGPRGPRGFTGATGPRGFTGAPGPKGAKGSTGAKGATGAVGATGATGVTGPTGPTGAQGPPGPAGTARAYAIVQPTSETAANLISGQTVNVTGVSEPSKGVYCVTPAAPIDASKEPAAVSPEVSYSSGGLPGIIAVNAQHPHCLPSAFEVDTYATLGTTTTTSGYAFTIVIP
jgi:hypothetical protein